MWSITTGGTVYFALGVLFDLYDGDRLKDLVVRAIWINRRAVWFSLMAAYLGLLVGYVIPLFAPLAAIAFPVFSYVVTRDLFEHGDGNRKSVRKRAAGRQTSPQPA
jgi:hypothetical protein